VRELAFQLSNSLKAAVAIVVEVRQMNVVPNQFDVADQNFQ
jgi:hypothetical protein